MTDKDKRIEELEQIVNRQIVQLEKQNLQLEEQAHQIQKLMAVIEEKDKALGLALGRIQELERRLGIDSKNSHQPPSQDMFKVRRVTSSREKGKKKSGGQEGHRGYTLEQVSHPDVIKRYEVDVCSSCHRDLKNQEGRVAQKRQVFDIPAPKIEVTEYQIEKKVCSCGKTTTSCFPEEVKAQVQYGERIKAFSVYLQNQQFIPEGRLQQLFQDMWNIGISTATIAEFSKRFAKKVYPHQEAILQQLKEGSVKHMDESGLKVGKKLHWLQVISNDSLTHYRVTEKRKDLLDGVKGVCVHDHFKPYLQMPNVEHAFCNAHHIRELRALIEFDKEPWATDMMNLMKVINSYSSSKNVPFIWLEQRYDDILKNGLKYHQSLPPFISEKKSKKGRIIGNGVKKRPGHNLCLRLRDFKDGVLRCLKHKLVPFTNNQAEQDIRMIKVKQKISGCFRTKTGADDFCLIRGFISTCRKQGKNIMKSIQEYRALPLTS